MPPFGRAHRLLSPTHPDTSPPAGGADPSDGQVATWSDALGGWIAADPAGGVTDHGALTGLYPDDDHAQYARADKSRPTTWVEAADLAGRSLADLGTKDHDLLDGLTDDDHSIYALLAGRSGGQTFVGDAAASGHLTLQSTAHATRGYVRAQDDLQLLSNIIRDAAGTNRLELAAASPHLTLTGDTHLDGKVAIGAGVAPHADFGLKVGITTTSTLAYGAEVVAESVAPTGQGIGYGLAGYGKVSGTPTWGLAYGLYFSARYNTSSYCPVLGGMYISLQSLVGGSGTIADAKGIELAGSFSGSKPTILRGVYLQANLAPATTGTAYGYQCEDFAATTVRLLELGPATPYLRLLGGANPAANASHLSLKFGATLKLLTEGAVNSGGAGFRQVIVPN